MGDKDEDPDMAVVVDSDDDDEEEEEEEQDTSENGNEETTASNGKEDRKAKRATKLLQQQEWLEQIPKVDKDGIAYTKFQIRKMVKRVKKGLPPLLSEEEERQRQANEAQLRHEEELELAGLIYNKHKNPQEDDDDEIEEEQVAERENGEDDEEVQDSSRRGGGGEAAASAVTACKPATTKKKKQRSKPVPDDYVCSACQNKNQPKHWIYDCPNKITKPGSNLKKKHLRGLNEPDNKKVFVSGLPFDTRPDDLKSIFESCGSIVSHRLLTFQDTGRCKGQAFVSFDTEEAAAKAIKQISGTVVDTDTLIANKESKKKRKRVTDPDKQQKKLKLKVSKVLNRRVTKKGGTTSSSSSTRVQ